MCARKQKNVLYDSQNNAENVCIYSLFLFHQLNEKTQKIVITSFLEIGPKSSKND